MSEEKKVMFRFRALRGETSIDLDWRRGGVASLTLRAIGEVLEFGDMAKLGDIEYEIVLIKREASA